MIRINLLTEGRGAKKAGGLPGPRPAVAAAGGEGAPPWPLHIAILAVFVIGILAYGGWLWMRNHTLAATIAQQEIELKKYEGAREKVAELEQRKTEYTAKLDQIKQLKDQQSVPVKLMNRLVEVLPEGAWYTGVKQAGQAISIDGRAKSIKTISTLYDNVVATSEFGDVQLGDVTQQSGGEETYAYKLAFNYYPGGKAKAAEAAAAAPKPAAPAPVRKPKAAAESME